MTRRTSLLAVPVLLALGLAACSGESSSPATVTVTETAPAGPADDGATTPGETPTETEGTQVFAEHGARDARVDCAGGAVEIRADGADVDVTGACTSVAVSGHGTAVDVEADALESLEISGNDVRADVDGDLVGLVVSGHGAYVEVGSVGSVQVSGNGARVEYERGPAPSMDDAGEGTSVVQD
jgi:hypothetical protein